MKIIRKNGNCKIKDLNLYVGPLETKHEVDYYFNRLKNPENYVLGIHTIRQVTGFCLYIKYISPLDNRASRDIQVLDDKF